jgi:phage gp36-like protein
MYCALADIENAISLQIIIELTDDDNLGQIDSTVLDAAIEWADAEIDSYLQAKYEVPLSTVPVLVKHISVDLTAFRLYSRRLNVEMPEAIKTRYDLAFEKLEKLQSGEQALDPANDTASTGGYRTNKTAEDREFGPETLDKY